VRTQNQHRSRVAVDIGGTFTDLVLLDERSGKMGFEKTQTTPEDPARGVMASIQKGRLELEQVGLFIHGTTLALNALLEGKGAKTGLITTKGFRDVLEIGRLDRPHMYDILYRKPPPLVPRHLRREVRERINPRGEVLVPLDEAETRAVVRWLRQQGISVFAVCLLHSYANSAHEKRVGEIVYEECPEAYVSLSHSIIQEFYEYERTVSTVINATIQPLMAQYLDLLCDDLTGNQFRGEFLITRSGGGAMSYRQAKEMPVHTVLSGPAGGVQGAAYLAKMLDIPHLIGIDAGGTSFDVSLLYRGDPQVRSEAKVAGYKLLLPVVDMETIGAGGGSVAWIDTGNALQVGPQSAGAHPGPICYGQGGVEPTVTDAAVSLGLINPANFLGGELQLDAAAADRGIAERLAGPLGLSPEDTASGILAIAETKMTGAIREMSVERGYDPREFTLLAYGGAGPLFAARLAERVGVPRVIVPRWPGNFSAWGMLMFDLVHDFVQSHVAVLEEISLETMNDIFLRLERSALGTLASQGVPQEDQLVLRSVDMKYLMAGHVINVPVANNSLKEGDQKTLRGKFNELHQLLYGHQLRDILQVVNFRLRAIGRVRKPAAKRISRGGRDPASAHKGSRLIYDPQKRRRVRYQVFDRSHLRAGNTLAGPAIVEEAASTTLVPAVHVLHVDPYGNLVLQREAS
jgi:N-methylhydantoinase A